MIDSLVEVFRDLFDGRSFIQNAISPKSEDLSCQTAILFIVFDGSHITFIT